MIKHDTASTFVFCQFADGWRLSLIEVRLLPVPAPGLPNGYPHPPVAREWWKTEVMVPADNHLAEPHVHVDHQYLAVVYSPAPAHTPKHTFDWFTAEELSGLAMPEDTRLLAKHLFDRIADLATGALDDAAVLRSFATASSQ